jgi:hypothetical protein
MKGEREPAEPTSSTRAKTLRLVRERVPAPIPLMVGRAFVRLWALGSPQLLARLLILVGLMVQVVLLLAAGYLIDLGISLMDLWAELARKHLELTL